MTPWDRQWCAVNTDGNPAKLTTTSPLVTRYCFKSVDTNGFLMIVDMPILSATANARPWGLINVICFFTLTNVERFNRDKNVADTPPPPTRNNRPVNVMFFFSFLFV